MCETFGKKPARSSTHATAATHSPFNRVRPIVAILPRTRLQEQYSYMLSQVGVCHRFLQERTSVSQAINNPALQGTMVVQATPSRSNPARALSWYSSRRIPLGGGQFEHLILTPCNNIPRHQSTPVVNVASRSTGYVWWTSAPCTFTTARQLVALPKVPEY